MNWKKRYRRLEDRVLLDAAGAVTVADSADAHDDTQESTTAEHRQEQEDHSLLVAALGQSQERAESTEAPATAPEILFVDSQVEDIDRLLANLSEDIEVYYIDAEEGFAEAGLTQLFISSVTATPENSGWEPRRWMPRPWRAMRVLTSKRGAKACRRPAIFLSTAAASHRAPRAWPSWSGWQKRPVPTSRHRSMIRAPQPWAGTGISRCSPVRWSRKS